MIWARSGDRYVKLCEGQTVESLRSFLAEFYKVKAARSSFLSSIYIFTLVNE